WTCGRATLWCSVPGRSRRRRRANCDGRTPSRWSPSLIAGLVPSPSPSPLRGWAVPPTRLGGTPAALWLGGAHRRRVCQVDPGAGGRELPCVDAVLRRLQPQLDEQLSGVSRLLAHRGYFRAFGGGEVLQHERRRVLAPRRTADPDPHPLKLLGAQCGRYRA